MAAATQRIYKPDGNKKDVGKCSVRAYPNYQAFALPLNEDKQRKPAHVSRHIYAYTTANVVSLKDDEKMEQRPCRHTAYPYATLVYIRKVSTPYSGEYTLLYIKGNVSRRKI